MPLRRLMLRLFVTFLLPPPKPSKGRPFCSRSKSPTPASTLSSPPRNLDGATADSRGQPDPNLVYLAAGDLVYAFTGQPELPNMRS